MWEPSPKAADWRSCFPVYGKGQAGAGPQRSRGTSAGPSRGRGAAAQARSPGAAGRGQLRAALRQVARGRAGRDAQAARRPARPPLRMQALHEAALARAARAQAFAACPQSRIRLACQCPSRGRHAPTRCTKRAATHLPSARAALAAYRCAGNARGRPPEQGAAKMLPLTPSSLQCLRV